MRLVVAATPEVALPSLQEIFTSEHQLVRVITQPDRPAGRGRSMQSTAVSKWAIEKKVEVSKPVNQSEFALLIADSDIVITIGYGVILKSNILEIPKFGFLNLHFSLLPRWRGAAPVQRAIESGDERTGVTVFKLDVGMDTGPIYLKREVVISQDATSESLGNELAQLGGVAILETLKMISNGVAPYRQSDEGATRAFKLNSTEAKIDWSFSAAEIERKIRAFYPAPVAWTQLRGEILKIESVQIVDESRLKVGELEFRNDQVLVGCNEGTILLDIVKPAGSAAMSGAAWARGLRLIGSEFCE